MSDQPAIGDILSLGQSKVFKADHRSRVWLTGDGQWVVKRFEHSRLKQTLTRIVGNHPAMREQRAATSLGRLGVQVVPVQLTAFVAGCGHVVTPYVGPSLQQRVTAGMLDDPHAAEYVHEQLLGRLRELVSNGYYFRDLQLANMVMQDHGPVLLIDVGSARKSADTRRRTAMVDLLCKTLTHEGAPDAFVTRFKLAARDVLGDTDIA